MRVAILPARPGCSTSVMEMALEWGGRGGKLRAEVLCELSQEADSEHEADNVEEMSELLRTTGEPGSVLAKLKEPIQEAVVMQGMSMPQRRRKESESERRLE